jgi:hypothetical protein
MSIAAMVNATPFETKRPDVCVSRVNSMLAQALAQAHSSVARAN